MTALAKVGGGGETVAAIETCGFADQMSYISTGGGAFLEFVEGKTLPALAALEKRGQPVKQGGLGPPLVSKGRQA